MPTTNHNEQSHTPSNVGSSSSRTRVQPKYHYPIFPDEDDDDYDDEDYTEGEAFTHSRKRKDTGQGSTAESVRKNTTDSKGPKKTAQKSDAEYRGKPQSSSALPSGEASTQSKPRVAAETLRKKNKKIAAVERNHARRDKQSAGLGSMTDPFVESKIAADSDGSDTLSSLPDEYQSGDERAQ